jgi:hypothetical protein
MATYWNVPLNLEIAKRYADLGGAAYDIETTIEICRRAEEYAAPDHYDGLLAEALTIAAVVRYARCFASGVRLRIPEDIVAQLSPEQQKRHARIIELRNKHITHSVNPFEENTVVASVSDRPEQHEITGVSVQSARVTSIGRDGFAALRELAETALAHLQILIEAERAKVFQAAKQLDFEELRSRDLPEAFAPSVDEVSRRRR